VAVHTVHFRRSGSAARKISLCGGAAVPGSGSSKFVGWFYEQDGQRTGPVTAGEIAARVQDGRLKPDDGVWRAYQDASGTYLYPARATDAMKP